MPSNNRGKTQATSLKSNTTITYDVYHLIVGFEVNKPEVYRTVKNIVGIQWKAHFVLENAGHTFMYLTKNKKITIFFSLGPKHSNDLQRAYGEGVADYHITEKVRLFRFTINQDAYNRMFKKAKQYRTDVATGESYYNILKNHTCAAASREIIKEGWSSVPLGKSYVSLSMTDNVAVGMPFVVNPYAFYEDMLNEHGNALCKLPVPANEKFWGNIMIKVSKGENVDDPSLNYCKN